MTDTDSDSSWDDSSMDLSGIDSTSWTESSIHSVDTVNSDSSLSEEIPNQLLSLKMYIQETNATNLNLESSGIGVKELKEILQVLPNSEILDLSLKNNTLSNGMKYMAEVLPNTMIKKLNVSSCSLLNSDFIHLAKCLKDTQITELDISGNHLNIGDGLASRIVPHLLASHLTHLSMGDNDTIGKAAVMIAEALPKMPITHLNLSSGTFYQPGLVSLFSLLPHTSITHLVLSETYISLACNCLGTEDELEELAQNLKYSNLSLLDLSNNLVNDAIMSDLVESLFHSNVIDLNLHNNELSNLGHVFSLAGSKIKFLDIGRNSFNSWGRFLFNDFFLNSCIHTLNVSYCGLDDKSGEKLMKSLKFSKVIKLNVCGNQLGVASMAGFAEVVKDTILEDLNLSRNIFFDSEALAILGNSLQESKLKLIDLSNTSKRQTPATALAAFIEKTKGSKIDNLKIGQNQLGRDIDSIALKLSGTTFTHFDLSSNDISMGLGVLAAHLKFSAVTHLDLSRNNICDAGAEAFAICLKDTAIIELNMKSNCIRTGGMIAIATALKSSSVLRLNLSCNGVENNGRIALTEAIKNTFIISANVVSSDNTNFASLMLGKNCERSVSLDEVLWQNRLKGFKLVTFFKKEILPDLNADNSFCFDRISENLDADTFLEKWLIFYKTIAEPSALSFLAQDERVPFSREQLATIFLEEFPQQIFLFIGTEVEADVSQHVRFLERVEAYGLSKIVKLLLLNRPIYTINEDQGILHPFIYELLLKYKQPVCNLAIEPEGIHKIIEYFTANPDLEGSSDVIRMLRDEESI